MKKQLTTLVLGLLCSSAFSQTNTFPASGNVGIGTTTIDNSQQWDKVLQVHGTGHAKLLVTESNGLKVGIFSHANYNGKIGTESNHNLTLMAGYWNDVMTLTTAGNVGVGTITPIAKFDIRGSVTKTGDGITMPTANVFSTNESAIGTGGAIALGGKSGNGNADYPFAYVMGGKESNLSDNYAGYFAINTVSSGGNGEVNSGNYERLRITSAGNVGIGTADPKGYKLAVAGNMIAESVKVKLQGTWPDYVFAPSYKIPTLQETEKHIKENGHLPGIPSASEVKANGVDLGDMNAKLLQKIEELTLHLIEKEKAMNALLKRVEVLEQKNK